MPIYKDIIHPFFITRPSRSDRKGKTTCSEFDWPVRHDLVFAALVNISVSLTNQELDFGSDVLILESVDSVANLTIFSKVTSKNLVTFLGVARDFSRVWRQIWKKKKA